MMTVKTNKIIMSNMLNVMSNNLNDPNRIIIMLNIQYIIHIDITNKNYTPNTS